MNDTNTEEQLDNYARMVYEHAEKLGVDIATEHYLLPLVQESLRAPLPSGWTSAVDEQYGVPYYTNTVTKESIWEHPSDQYYLDLIDKERHKYEQVSVSSVNADETLNATGSTNEGTAKPTVETITKTSTEEEEETVVQQIQTMDNFSPPKGPRNIRPSFTAATSVTTASTSTAMKSQPVIIDSGIDYAALSFSSPLSNTSDVSFTSASPPLDFTPPTPITKVSTTSKPFTTTTDDKVNLNATTTTSTTNSVVAKVLFVHDNTITTTDTSTSIKVSPTKDKKSLNTMELRLDSDEENENEQPPSPPAPSISSVTSTLPVTSASSSAPTSFSTAPSTITSAEIHRLQQELHTAKQQLTETNTNLANLQTNHAMEIENLRKEIQTINILNEKLQEQLHKQDQQKQQYEQERIVTERKHQEEITALRTNLYNEISRKNEELYVPILNSLKTDNEGLKTELNQQRKETETLLSRCYNAENKYLSLDNQYQSLMEETKLQKQEIQRLSKKLMNNEQNDEIISLQNRLQEKENSLQLKDQEIAALKITKDMARTSAVAELETIKAREQKSIAEAVQKAVQASEKEWQETLQTMTIDQQKLKEKYEVQITRLHTQLDLTKEELREHTQRNKVSDNEGSTYRNELQDLQTKYSVLQEKYEGTERKNKDLETRLEVYQDRENQFLTEWNNTIQDNQTRIDDEKHLNSKLLSTTNEKMMNMNDGTEDSTVTSNSLFSSTVKYSPSKTMNRTFFRSYIRPPPPPTPSLGSTVALGPSSSSGSLSVSTLSLLKECGISYVPGNAIRHVTSDTTASVSNNLGSTVPKFIQIMENTNNGTSTTSGSSTLIDPALTFASSRLGFSTSKSNNGTLSSFTPSLSYAQPLGISSLATSSSTMSNYRSSSSSLSLTNLQLQSPSLRSRAIEIFSGV